MFHFVINANWAWPRRFLWWQLNTRTGGEIGRRFCRRSCGVAWICDVTAGGARSPSLLPFWVGRLACWWNKWEFQGYHRSGSSRAAGLGLVSLRSHFHGSLVDELELETGEDEGAELEVKGE